MAAKQNLQVNKKPPVGGFLFTELFYHFSSSLLFFLPTSAIRKLGSISTVVNSLSRLSNSIFS